VGTDPGGTLLSQEEWTRRRSEWLPGDEDEVYVKSLMQGVHEPGKIAQWIAPPRRGINGRPFEFEYVRLPG
jgi:benzoyl-CoA 2,3-dioxygenase component B